MEYKNEASYISAMYRKKHLDGGMCCDCGSVPFVAGKKRCEECLRKAREGTNKYRSKNKEQVRKSDMAGYYRHHAKRCASAKDRTNKLRAEIFERYGGAVCACCGIIDWWTLSLDHIENNGAAHRRELFPGRGNGRGGYKMYRILKKQGFPPGFQVLCMNCNIGKVRNNGICPHKAGEPSPLTRE